MLSIQGIEHISFHGLERAAFRMALKSASEVLVSDFKQLDEHLLQVRDRDRFEVKELREKEVDTLVGTIRFRRRYYYDTHENEYVALLDRVLDLESGQRVSPGLTEVVVTQGVRGPSYREARDSLKDLYGHQVISHETVRRRVIDTGEQILQEQKRLKEKPEGRRKVSTLYLEVDGYSASMQEDDKRRREAQMMYCHEGWRKRHPLSKEYELVGGHFYSRLADSSTDFWEEASRYLYSIYNLSEDTQVIINGDRAKWIRRGVDYFHNAMYQMDRWHMVRDLRNLLRGTGKAKEALDALYADDTPQLLVALAEAEQRLPEGDKKDQLVDLKEDILANPEAVRDYRKRLKEQGLDVREMRGMGAAESQVDRFENRVSKRGQSWRTRGLTAMLCSLGEHLLGSLDRFTKRTPFDSQLNIPDCEQQLKGVAKEVIQKTFNAKQAHPVIKDVGTSRSGGLSQLLHQLGRASPTMI